MTEFKVVPSLPYGITVTPEAVRHFNTFLQPFGLLNVPGSKAFMADNLITFNRQLNFLADKKFTAAFEQAGATQEDATMVWRKHVLCWGARHGLALDGDFVECGTYRGFLPSLIIEFTEFDQSEKYFYLYDMFVHTGDDFEGHKMDEHGEGLYTSVINKFEKHPFVNIIRGVLPDSISQEPAKIAFLHIDLGNSRAEAATLDALFDRLTPGAVVILNCYGWAMGPYKDSMAALDAVANARGHFICELPTGQGLLIKH